MVFVCLPPCGVASEFPPNACRGERRGLVPPLCCHRGRSVLLGSGVFLTSNVNAGLGPIIGSSLLFFAMFILGFCGLLFSRCVLARCANIAGGVLSVFPQHVWNPPGALPGLWSFRGARMSTLPGERVSRKIAEIKPLSSRVKASTTFGVMTPVFISFQLKRCNAAGGFARSRRSAGCACFSLAPGGRVPC